MTAKHAPITLAQLNRATLARQHLLERKSMTVVDAVEKLGALQAQYSPSPYIALWSRIEDFRLDQLTAELQARRVVKATMMRNTLHLVSAGEYPLWKAALADVRGWWVQSVGADISDTGALAAGLRPFFEEGPRTQQEVLEFLGGDGPLFPPWRVVRARGWVVHAPPSGTWRYFGKSTYTWADDWLPPPDREPDEDDCVRLVVRRHLEAFGPSSKLDVASWTGLRAGRLSSAFEALAPELCWFTGPDGRALADLADAPRPPADVPAPVRYLSKWDSILLAHQRRHRFMTDEQRAVVIRGNGDVQPTFIVDGRVAGVWSVATRRGEATLALVPFGSLGSRARSDLREEGERLLAFMEPEAVTRAVAGLDEGGRA